MTDQQRAEEGDEELELTPDMEVNPDDAGNDDGDDEDNPETNDEDEQTIVAFEGEEPETEPENSTVRQMRQALREKDKRIKELEQSSAPKPIDVGPKPELWSDEIAGDEALYDQKMDEWRDRKAAADRHQETQAEQSRKANEEWQQDLSSFEAQKAGLQFDDRDDVIETATSSLDMVQQAVVVKAAAAPALFFYALGKSEARRAELSKIQDPIKLAAAVARMEGAVKVTKGRKAPEPDRPLSGSSKMPGGADKELEKLERQAAANGGDRSKVIAYKKSKGLLG